MVLKLENIDLSFKGLYVLKNLNLTIKDGEFICLLGPSGCGKTSTLRVCAGLESPDSGRVILNDTIVTDGANVVAPERRKIGFLFQDFALFPHLNIYDNVAFGLKGWSRGEIDLRVKEVLKQVQMDRFAKALPHTLSGGQQQRIALARALAPKPQIILLDEPFSGLDSSLRAQIRDETLHVLKDNNVAAVMVTHDPEEAMFMADRIILMKDGHIVQEGPPTELYQNPINHFAASFFGEVNVIKGVIKANKAHTVLGNVPTSGFTDDTIVDVLVRPENIKIQRILDDIGSSEKAHIKTARFLGRDSLLHIAIEDTEGTMTHLHARIQGHFLLKDNERVMATMDHKHVFVFHPN
jgi:iron(III) transport system ATP-binding protein